MSKSVENGKLVTLSPSSISKFDPSQAFGCNRKWWFRYVAGLPEPTTGSQKLGDDLHKLIEHRLKHGQTPQAEGEAAGLYLAGQRMIDDVAAQKAIIAVEAPVKYSILGIPIHPMSKCDVVHRDGIIDWKTSSDIRRYGKTEAELAKDIQLSIYGKAFHPTLERVSLAHGQFQTKGTKRTQYVEVVVAQETLDKNHENVIVPLVKSMIDVAAETDSAKVEADTTKCFNCAFRALNKCSTMEGNPIVSFFKKTPAVTSAAPAAPEPQKVVPPDAPASDPALAAKPVENFTPVPAPRKHQFVDVPAPEAKLEPQLTPEQLATAKANDAAVAADKAETAKRGPGRPKGSPNKPKVVEPAEPRETGIRVTSITISHGATINLGNYNSARVEVTMTAETAGDPQVARALLSEQVELALNAEAQRYEGSVVIQQDGKGNATKTGTRADIIKGG